MGQFSNGLFRNQLPPDSLSPEGEAPRQLDHASLVPFPSAPQVTREVIHDGTPLAPGLGVGRAYLVSQAALYVGEDQVEPEIARLRESIHQARCAISKQIEAACGEQRSLLGLPLQLLANFELDPNTYSLIRNEDCRFSQRHVVELYFREKIEGVPETPKSQPIREAFERVREELLQVINVQQQQAVQHTSLEQIPNGVVLVADEAREIDLDSLSEDARRRIKGIVVRGSCGLFSRLAQVARDHKIPLVSETPLPDVRFNQVLVVEGSKGEVRQRIRDTGITAFRGSRRVA